jgi:hypothetical protein
MTVSARTIRIAGVGAVLVAAAALGATTFANGPALSDAGSANVKVAGMAAPDKLSVQWRETTLAQGSNLLENGSALTNFYGYYNDGPMVPPPGAVQSPGHNVEATKSEPDKNTYLVVKGQHGADAKYDYGTHFLYQGHELGTSAGSYITRINLDADAGHRVTKLAETLADGKTPVPEIDGSTWDPFAQRLLFTTEGGDEGGVTQGTLDYPSKVTRLWGVIGQGGYEGIQNDDLGNIYIVEDSGGPNGKVNTHARQPNSFIFRFLPADPANLDKGGKLQVLQVASLAHAGPIVFHDGMADADILSADVKDLHTYGKSFKTTWVTIHDTKDSTAAFDANAAAKKANGTPFKRPENGVFKPGTDFHKFFFTETGDTSASTEAGTTYGGFGGIFELKQDPESDKGWLKIFYVSDKTHSSFDNLTFFTNKQLLVGQDQGDGLHTSINALDSAFMFDVNDDYAGGAQPLRVIAEGRDASATIDSALLGIPNNGFQNDGDNELTGIHESNGDPTADGVLGAANPKGLSHDWRLFFTHQHGDNVTSEIIPA